MHDKDIIVTDANGNTRLIRAVLLGHIVDFVEQPQIASLHNCCHPGTSVCHQDHGNGHGQISLRGWRGGYVAGVKQQTHFRNDEQETG